MGSIGEELMENRDWLENYNMVMESDWIKDQLRKVREEKRRSGRDYSIEDMIIYGINCITLYRQGLSIPMFEYMGADGRCLISELLGNGIL
jgi:hypothetical protein